MASAADTVTPPTHPLPHLQPTRILSVYCSMLVNIPMIKSSEAAQYHLTTHSFVSPPLQKK
jgi:hypothetical protein